MRRLLIALCLLACTALPAHARSRCYHYRYRPYRSRSYSSHRYSGYYSGGIGSSHKGGHYRNPRTSDQYRSRY